MLPLPKLPSGLLGEKGAAGACALPLSLGGPPTSLGTAALAARMHAAVHTPGWACRCTHMCSTHAHAARAPTAASAACRTLAHVSTGRAAPAPRDTSDSGTLLASLGGLGGTLGGEYSEVGLIVLVRARCCSCTVGAASYNTVLQAAAPAACPRCLPPTQQPSSGLLPSLAPPLLGG